MIYLPSDWDFTDAGLKDKRNLWPIQLLVDCVDITVGAHSSVSWGASSFTECRQVFAEGVPYSAVIVLFSQPDIYKYVSAPLSSGKSVDFLQVFPLTEEECDYKLCCAEDEECESEIDVMLDHFNMDREHWIDFALGRFSYRNKK